MKSNVHRKRKWHRNTQLANIHKMDFPLIIFLLNCLLAHSFTHSASPLFQLPNTKPAQFYRIYCACIQFFFPPSAQSGCLCEKSFHFTFFYPFVLLLSSLHLKVNAIFIFLRMVFHYTLSFICMRKQPFIYTYRHRHPLSPTAQHIIETRQNA